MFRKRRHKPNLLFCLSVLVFTAYVALSLVTMQLKVAAKRRELAAINASIEQQQAANAQIERLLQYGEDKDYVEYVAHEKLGYAYPDEKILIDRSAG